MLQSKHNANNKPTRIGSAASVIVNVIVIIVVNVYYSHVSFLTPDFIKWLPIFNIMTGVGIVSYFLLFIVNTQGFRTLVELITAILGVWGFYYLNQIFPFEFYSANLYTLVRIVIYIAIFGSAIAVIVNLIKLFAGGIASIQDKK